VENAGKTLIASITTIDTTVTNTRMCLMEEMTSSIRGRDSSATPKSADAPTLASDDEFAMNSWPTS